MGRPPGGAGAAASSSDCTHVPAPTLGSHGGTASSAAGCQKPTTRHSSSLSTGTHAPGHRPRPPPGSSAAGCLRGAPPPRRRPRAAAAGCPAAGRRPAGGRGRGARWTPGSGRAGRGGCRGLQRGGRRARWRGGGGGGERQAAAALLFAPSTCRSINPMQCTDTGLAYGHRRPFAHKAAWPHVWRSTARSQCTERCQRAA